MIGFVAGFGRCGTSLTMAMLAAGGLPVVGRGAIFEDPHFTPGRTNERWLLAQSGRIVKWVCPLSTYCPEAAQGRILWLDRDPEEQARSQVKLALACGERWADPDAKASAIAAQIRDHTDRALSYASDQGPVARLSFEDLLSDPLESAKRIAAFFRPFGVLDVARASAVVRPRGAACADGMEVDIATVRRELAFHA
jgi:hypothetical protein